MNNARKLPNPRDVIEMVAKLLSVTRTGENPSAWTQAQPGKRNRHAVTHGPSKQASVLCRIEY